MDNKLQFQDKTYHLERYPITTDTALRAWNTTDVLALDYISEKKLDTIHLFNDRFGVWNVVLHDKKPITIWTYASQQKAIIQNLALNKCATNIVFKTPLEKLESIDTALIRIPKSVALFELFLQQIHTSAHENTEVVCGFMTKYFTPSFLEIAGLYFEEVAQTKAWKKARLLVLKKPKQDIPQKTYINTIEWKNYPLQQYYGVFSADKIDIGTQFLLKHLEVGLHENKVLDLASGNGIIGYEVAQQHPEVELTLVDDFNLAIASSKINLKGKNAEFLCADNLDELPKEFFDLVVSNPPFHFEHENNIEVSLSLFKQVAACLQPNGRFVLVANTHLNYKTHLITLFTNVQEIKQNNKFVIYECKK